MFETFMKDHRTVQEKVYFSGIEADAIEDRAGMLGIPKSAYIRQLVLIDLESARRQRVWANHYGDDRTDTGLK